MIFVTFRINVDLCNHVSCPQWLFSIVVPREFRAGRGLGELTLYDFWKCNIVMHSQQ